jgi:hypothetical protein
MRFEEAPEQQLQRIGEERPPRVEKAVLLPSVI